MIHNHKKRIKVKWKNVFLAFLLLVFSILFFISLINIIKWLFDSIRSNQQIDDILENTNINDILDNDNTELISGEDDYDKSNPYWDYIKVPLMSVNFNELKQLNSDTAGWIQVRGTNINYPFVQTNDNSFYLEHSFNKKSNKAGWVFMDYRNNKDLFNKNTIIYAHGRLDSTMFGSLKNILTSGWLNDKNNYIVRLSTDTENTLWQVFSIYEIPTTSDYLKVNFKNDKEFLEFADMLINRSAHNFNTKVGTNSKILTLSTCHNTVNKVVLHAKLIKREKR